MSGNHPRQRDLDRRKPSRRVQRLGNAIGAVIGFVIVAGLAVIAVSVFVWLIRVLW